MEQWSSRVEREHTLSLLSPSSIIRQTDSIGLEYLERDRHRCSPPACSNMGGKVPLVKNLISMSKFNDEARLA